jgi:hypothetical protein
VVTGARFAGLLSRFRTAHEALTWKVNLPSRPDPNADLTRLVAARTLWCQQLKDAAAFRDRLFNVEMAYDLLVPEYGPGNEKLNDYVEAYKAAWIWMESAVNTKDIVTVGH